MQTLSKMVVVAQLVRALVCGTRGRRFEPGLPPLRKKPHLMMRLFLILLRPIVLPQSIVGHAISIKLNQINYLLRGSVLR